MILQNNTSIPKSLRRFSNSCPSVNQINATHLLPLSFTTKFITLKVPLISSVSVTFAPGRREKCYACMINRWEQPMSTMTPALTQVLMTSFGFVVLMLTLTVKSTLKKLGSTAGMKQSGTHWLCCWSGSIRGVGNSSTFHEKANHVKFNNVINTFGSCQSLSFQKIWRERDKQFAGSVNIATIFNSRCLLNPLKLSLGVCGSSVVDTFSYPVVEL